MWFVYILQCADNSLYTGISNDIEERLKWHKDGKGARYTRSHLPVGVVYQENYRTKGAALKREIQIKQFSREKKNDLINKAAL